MSDDEKEEAPSPASPTLPRFAGEGREREDSSPSPAKRGRVGEAGEGAAPRKAAVLAVLLYLAFNLLLPLVRVPLAPLRALPGWLAVLLVIVVPTALFMLVQLSTGRALAQVRPRPLTSLSGMALGALLWLWIARFLPTALLQSVCVGLGQTLAFSFFGILVSCIVREANILLPVALIAIAIDYIGVLTRVGLTRDVAEKHPEIIAAVAVKVPAIGGLKAMAYIGPADIVFMALFFAVVDRLHLNRTATFRWMFALLTLALLLPILVGVNVPALVPMGVAVLAANWRAFRLKRAEVFAVLYASVIIIAVVAAFYSYTHSHLFHSGATHDNRRPVSPAPGRPAGNR